MNRIALLSMDVEDWYHLDYFRDKLTSSPVSTLDGLDRFADLLREENVPATFFALGDAAQVVAPRLRNLIAQGHEIASHGPDHALLGERTTAEFVRDMRTHKDSLEQLLGSDVVGYRAPCFSMNEEKLATLPEIGFRYDSSWIRFENHPLYGSMKLESWPELRPGVRRSPKNDLLEFEIATAPLLGRKIPVAGGAYLRVFPWALMRRLLDRFMRDSTTYTFYIHPAECSAVRSVPLPAGTSFTTRMRFDAGRAGALDKLRNLIGFLRRRGFAFSTYRALAQSLNG